MPAKTQLKDLLNQYGPEIEIETQTATKSPEARKEVNDKLPPSRRGKRHISGYFEPEVLRQVKIIGAEQDKTINQVLADALNALFTQLGKPPIA